MEYIELLSPKHISMHNIKKLNQFHAKHKFLSLKHAFTSLLDPSFATQFILLKNIPVIC